MVTTKRIVIGIASETVIRQRVLAIARGEYKPKKGEPKIWFTSAFYRQYGLVKINCYETPRNHYGAVSFDFQSWLKLE